MMNSITEMDRRKEESKVLKEIKQVHSKLKRLYEKLDEFDYNTSYSKLWLKAQQDALDHNVDTSKPYWVK